MATDVSQYHHQHTSYTEKKRSFCDKNNEVRQRIVEVYSRLQKHGVHSGNRLKTAGFIYTGNGDTARCETCGLEVSEWNREMDPFIVHRERSPNCLFIHSIQVKDNSTQNYVENAAKRQKTEHDSNIFNQYRNLVECKLLEDVRKRTFSHWASRDRPTKEQMIAAGFFNCNVGDRVICLYCNIIAQQWKKDTDDPVNFHKVLSPKCPYVLSMLTDRPSSVLIVNDMPTNNSNNNTNPIGLLPNMNQFQSDQIVYTSPYHANYSSIPSRQATFENWNNEAAPPVDELVRAGFFYTNRKTIVTCFYCNGSLQNWGPNDKPLIEHIRWFPFCQYAKQLAGTDLYNKIQETKRIQQARTQSQHATNTMDTAPVANNQPLQINDERFLSRLVAARLDLPVSQRLLDQNFKLSVIKRCWEDQLQLKQADFVSDCDLYIACVILQKQIEYINGNKDNIIVPSIKMKMIQEGGQADVTIQEPVVPPPPLPSTTLVDNSAKKTVETPKLEPMTVDDTTDEQTKKVPETHPDVKVTLNNPCVLCWKEEKRLACIPCGHLASCTNCSQTLRTCPICRRGIEAFVRIYL